MSIHKDHKRNTWYFAVRIDGKQYKRRSKDWTLKRHAVEAEREFITEYSKGHKVLSTDTFKEVAGKYLNHIKLYRKIGTLKNKELTLKNHILPFFGDMVMIDIALKDIEDFQLYTLEKTYTRKGEEVLYSNDYMATIQLRAKEVFTYAVMHRIINFNPFDQVEIVRRHTPDTKKEVTIITKEEYDRFIDVVEDKTERALFSTLFWCGLRIGELLALDISDYNRSSKQLNIYKSYNNHQQQISTTKTGNNRIVDVPQQCQEDIEALLDSYKEFEYKSDFPLFGFTRRLSKSTLERSKQRYIEESGVPYFTFHELRHTHVSVLIQLGMRDIDIAKRLGHSVVMVNETYGHLFPSDKEKMMNKLNSL